jgi:hypothetical protein
LSRWPLALLLLGLAWLAPAAPAAQDGRLQPGEYAWTPALAPEGPVLVVVSLPDQHATVYRNGVRIGASTVSTGRPGHDTPVGVYTILQKRREHYSNLYDDAPMPFMQRLTWDGIALHAGHLPGYPASHGCIRLPVKFAELLFGATSMQTTVVVSDAVAPLPSIVAGPFAGAGSLPLSDRDQQLHYAWKPERAPDGPMTVLLGTRDRLLLVLRDGVEIGRARVSIAEDVPRGTYAYALHESAPATDGRAQERRALSWSAITVAGGQDLHPDLRALISEGRLVVPPAFARAVYDALVAGTTLVVTDESLNTNAGDLPPD